VAVFVLGISFFQSQALADYGDITGRVVVSELLLIFDPAG